MCCGVMLLLPIIYIYVIFLLTLVNVCSVYIEFYLYFEIYVFTSIPIFLFCCFVCVDCYNWFNMDNCFHNCYHDPSLGLTSICVEEQMSLLPMHLGNISGGVKQKLNSFIGSFSEK